MTHLASGRSSRHALKVATCSICSNSRRAAIEAAAANGDTAAAIAIRFNLNQRSLANHLASHASASLPPRSPAPERTRSTNSPPGARRAPSPPSSLDVDADDAPDSPITSRSPTSRTTARAKVDSLIRALERIAADLPPDASVADRATILRASVQPIRLLGQLTGELGTSEANVVASPFYRRVRALIVEALRRHPDALRDVVDALERAEGKAREVEAAAE